MLRMISTVFVPVQPTTRDGTNPKIYGSVVSPDATGIQFVTDPQQGTAIDDTKYDADILGWARNRVAEAIRACALEACVLNMPRAQLSIAVPEATAGPGTQGVDNGENARTV